VTRVGTLELGVPQDRTGRFFRACGTYTVPRKTRGLSKYHLILLRQ